jgi:hypothetical protein
MESNPSYSIIQKISAFVTDTPTTNKMLRTPTHLHKLPGLFSVCELWLRIVCMCDLNVQRTPPSIQSLQETK